MTKIIGLTGGIGSGKTTVANYFHSFGIPIYIADDEARILMQSDEILNQVKVVFGSEIFENNILNRKKLAQIVFENPKKLEQLQNIIHPAVRKHFQNWLSKHKNEPYILYEAAILFESGNYKTCNKIITITAPFETRIARVIKRDKTTRKQVIAKMNAQWSDEERIAKSDFVIENTLLESTKSQVDNILKNLDISQ